jgi:hypothetical protein
VKNIDIYSFCLSIIAIGFTAFQAITQRIHNKKTVKPIGRIRIGDYEDNIFVRIENSGVGPLIIKKVSIQNGKLHTTRSLIDILPADLTKRIDWTNFTKEYEGRAIIPGQALELIVWTINSSYENKSSDVIEKDRRDLRKALKELSISMIYTDIYEEKNFEHEQKNDYFRDCYGRHDKE